MRCSCVPVGLSDALQLRPMTQMLRGYPWIGSKGPRTPPKEAALCPRITWQKESMALQFMIAILYQIKIIEYIPMLSSHPELSSGDRPLHASQVGLHRKNIPPNTTHPMANIFIFLWNACQDLALTLRHEHL